MRTFSTSQLTECLCQFYGDFSKILVDSGVHASIPDIDQRRESVKNIADTLEDRHVVAIWLMFRKAENASWGVAWTGKKSARQLLAEKITLEERLKAVNKELSLLEKPR